MHHTFEIRNSLFQLQHLLFCPIGVLPVQQSMWSLVILVTLHEISYDSALASNYSFLGLGLKLLGELSEVLWDIPQMMPNQSQIFELASCQVEAHILLLSSFT